MAIKAIWLRKQIDTLRAEMAKLEAEEEKLATRAAELEAAIEEVNEDTPQEQRDALDEAIGEHEEAVEELEGKKNGLQAEIDELEEDLKKQEEEQEPPAEEPEEPKEERKDDTMDKKFTVEEMQERKAFVETVRALVNKQPITRGDDYNMTQGNNGYIVPKTIAEEVITKVCEICPIFEQAHRYDIKGTLEIPFYPASSSHVVAAGYKDEMAALEASSGDFGTIELTGFLAGALAKISKKLINNTDIDVIPFITDQMAEAFRVFYEHEGLVGTASKATGLLAGIAAANTVTGFKTKVTADQLIDVQDKVPDAFQGNCCWIMHSETRNAIRKLKNQQGEYLLNKDITEGFGYTLLGKPVYLSDNMPKLGTNNNKAVVYGDLSGLAYKVAEDLEIEVLNELFATQHAVGVIGWTEIDTKVENEQKFACLKCSNSDS